MSSVLMSHPVVFLFLELEKVTIEARDAYLKARKAKIMRDTYPEHSVAWNHLEAHCNQLWQEYTNLNLKMAELQREIVNSSPRRTICRT